MPASTAIWLSPALPCLPFPPLLALPARSLLAPMRRSFDHIGSRLSDDMAARFIDTMAYALNISLLIIRSSCNDTRTPTTIQSAKYLSTCCFWDSRPRWPPRFSIGVLRQSPRLFVAEPSGAHGRRAILTSALGTWKSLQSTGKEEGEEPIYLQQQCRFVGNGVGEGSGRCWTLLEWLRDLMPSRT